MDKKKLFCSVCNSLITFDNLEDYYICDNCHTIKYHNKYSAKIDNDEYFNNYYNYTFSSKNKYYSKIYNILNYFHDKFYYKINQKYHKLNNEIKNLMKKAPFSIEIGFGGGDELVGFIESGCNIYGYEQSITAVEQFQKKHPHLSDRVIFENNMQLKKNLIYSNALIEHLDDPIRFIKSQVNNLESKGYFIFKMPILLDYNISLEKNDINLWKPCHRNIIHVESILTILKDSNLKLIDYSTFKYFGYKVMNKMLDKGYKDIMYIRCPYDKRLGIHLFNYLSILLSSFFDDLSISDSIFITQKID